jgi:carbonic anhydrase
VLTQTAPGELFILRNAGNIVPAFGLAVGGVTATIEYAVRALEVGEIIVCGHSNCGAMGGVLFPEKVAKLRSVASWLRFGEPARLVVERNHAHLSGDELLRVLTEQNVIAQMNNLRTHPSVAAGLAAGSLRVHGWTYDLKTGEVREYAAGEGEFRPLGSASGEDVDQELPAAVAQG